MANFHLCEMYGLGIKFCRCLLESDRRMKGKGSKKKVMGARYAIAPNAAQGRGIVNHSTFWLSFNIASTVLSAK